MALCPPRRNKGGIGPAVVAADVVSVKIDEPSPRHKGRQENADTARKIFKPIPIDFGQNRIILKLVRAPRNWKILDRGDHLSIKLVSGKVQEQSV
jgi:hypothetical protein